MSVRSYIVDDSEKKAFLLDREVLVSEEAAERARRAGIAVTDRGLHSFKGLPGTRRVFTVSR